MLFGKPVPDSQREDNTQGAAHRKVDETQVVKDTKSMYTARKAEMSVCCIPAKVPVEDELGRRGAGAELQQRAAKRETRAMSRTERGLSCCSKCGLDKTI